MKGFASALFLLFSVTFLAKGQIGQEHRETWLEAESYFLFEEYADALVYYQQLNRYYPDNDNINFKIGVCLLNDPFRKEESIAWLEKAVQNTDPKYKEDSYRETKAPTEAYFYLGNAYRINNQLDTAISTYRKFKEIGDPGVYDFDLVDKQIESCEHAKELMGDPVDFDMVNLGDRINSRFSDVNPVISGDRTKMVFLQKQAFTDAFFYSEKTDGQWSYPRILNPDLLLDVDDFAYPTGLSWDGTVLLLYKSDDYNGNIYVSRNTDGRWTPPEKLSDNINTKYWESHACFSRDGKTLYFTSNRKGSNGGLDIYMSHYDEEEQEWGKATNLGKTINSPYNEESPYISADGRTLYFSSYGHYNMGGYDIFYSTLDDRGKWTEPVNLGYPINTTDDDQFYEASGDAFHAYLSKVSPDGYGRTDIYAIEIFNADHPRMFAVKGRLDYGRYRPPEVPVGITVLKKPDKDTLTVIRPDRKSNTFSFRSARGSFELVVNGPEIKTLRDSFTIPGSYRKKEFHIEPDLAIAYLDSVAALPGYALARKLEVEDTLYLAAPGDSVDIGLGLPAGAMVYVKNRTDLAKITTDTLFPDTTAFHYVFRPVTGRNLLTFGLIDTAGGTGHPRDVAVICTPRVASAEGQGTDSAGARTVIDTQAILLALDTAGTGRMRPADTMRAAPDTVEVAMVTDTAATGIMPMADSQAIALNQETVQDTIPAGGQQPVKPAVSEPEPVDPGLLKAIERMSELAGGELKETLLELDPAALGIHTEQELVRYLKENTERFGYGNQEVHDVILNRIQLKYLGEYIEQLKSISGDTAMIRAFNETNLVRDRITSLQDIYDHMIGVAGTYGYGIPEVNRVFAMLSQRAGVREMMNIITSVAGKELRGFTAGIDPAAQGIDNTVGLFDYLLSHSKREGYTEAEVLNIMFTYLEGEDLRHMLATLKANASGELLSVLNGIDPETDHIENVSDLFNYLQAESQDVALDESTVYTAFLGLLEHVEEEKVLADLHITEIPGEVRGNGTIYWAAGASLLVILLIALYLRRRKRSSPRQDKI